MDLQRRHSVSGVEEAHSRAATGSKDLVGDGDGSDDEKMVIDEDKGKKSLPECIILSKACILLKKEPLYVTVEFILSLILILLIKNIFLTSFSLIFWIFFTIEIVACFMFF